MAILLKILDALFSILPDICSEWREARRIEREKAKAKEEKEIADEKRLHDAIDSGDPDFIGADHRRLHDQQND